MIMDNYKFLYKKSLASLGDSLHFVAHSHHLWPDASLKGHEQYWLDSMKMNDKKWEYIFGDLLTKTQKNIAALLNIKDHTSLVLAPNTHEFINRILSLFPLDKKIKILTTDSEFYSFERQLRRLEEEGFVAKRMPADLLLIDRKKFIEDLKMELQSNQYDLFFISQVFFNSGMALSQLEIEALMRACPEETIFVLDGYHGFAAIPLDLSHLSKRIFYLAGGYKYAQAGEGLGFLNVPEGDFRPRNTGWFAEITSLSNQKSKLVSYQPGSYAFWGATQDPSGWYRFNAVWDEFFENKITLQMIHEYVKKLQQNFILEIPKTSLKNIPLLHQASFDHGHFLTFIFPNDQEAKNFVEELQAKKIMVDRRANRIRFGFGIYQSHSDLLKLLNNL